MLLQDADRPVGGAAVDDDQFIRTAGLRRELLVVVDQTYDYCAFSAPTYAAGLLYSRLLQALPLTGLRNAILGVYRAL